MTNGINDIKKKMGILLEGLRQKRRTSISVFKKKAEQVKIEELRKNLNIK